MEDPTKQVHMVALLETGGLVPKNLVYGYTTCKDWQKVWDHRCKGQGIAMLVQQGTRVLGVSKSTCYISLVVYMPVVRVCVITGLYITPVRAGFTPI